MDFIFNVKNFIKTTAINLKSNRQKTSNNKTKYHAIRMKLLLATAGFYLVGCQGSEQARTPNDKPLGASPCACFRPEILTNSS